jgi:hypothetical protein
MKSLKSLRTTKLNNNVLKSNAKKRSEKEKKLKSVSVVKL